MGTRKTWGGPALRALTVCGGRQVPAHSARRRESANSTQIPVGVTRGTGIPLLLCRVLGGVLRGEIRPESHATNGRPDTRTLEGPRWLKDAEARGYHPQTPSLGRHFPYPLSCFGGAATTEGACAEAAASLTSARRARPAPLPPRDAIPAAATPRPRARSRACSGPRPRASQNGLGHRGGP